MRTYKVRELSRRTAKAILAAPTPEELAKAIANVKAGRERLLAAVRRRSSVRRRP